MGKTGGSSWLTAVKRAFRSPTKESEKRSSRRREENEQEEEEKVQTCVINFLQGFVHYHHLVFCVREMCFWVCAEEREEKMDFPEAFESGNDCRTLRSKEHNRYS